MTHKKQEIVNVLILRYRTYTRWVHRMLYLGGVLQERTRSVVWSYITGLFVILLCFSQCMFAMNFGWDHTDNLVLLLKCFGLTCSFITPVLMSICFLVKREKLIEVDKILNELFEQELARDYETKANLLATLHTFDKPSYLFCFVIGFTIVLFYYPPVLLIIHQTIHHIEPKRYRLPLPGKFPWPVPTSGFFYYLHFLYQMSTCWWLIFTIVSVDSLFGLYAFQISSILRAMSVRLADLRSQEVSSEILETCAKIHYQLMRCGHMLEDIWGPIILRMFLTNAILICTLIYEASPFTELTITRFFSFISYMGIKLIQTSIYAWYGSLITSASEHFRVGIYFSKWPDSNLDRHIKASLIMIMMQKPITLKALKISFVNINMLTNILNTGVSYFFLLQSLSEGG